VTRLILCLAIVVAVQGQPERTKASGKPNPPNTSKPASSPTPLVGEAGITMVNQQAPEKEQVRAATPPDNYFKRLSSPEILPQIILCAVGIAGVIIAVFTLGKIATQAREMRHQRIVMRGQLGTMRRQLREMQTTGEQTAQIIEQAKKQVTELHGATEAAIANAHASLANWEAIKNSERPWLFISIKTTPARYDGSGLQDNLGFSVSFCNYGKTPAEIVSFEQHPDCRDSTDDLPWPPKYSEEGRVMAHTRMVPAGETWLDQGESFFQPQTFLMNDQWKDIQRSRKRLVYWGRLRYRDLIEEPKTIHELKELCAIHDTCFCYFWSPSLNEFLICGLVGYNKHT
jgi:hypothetical protein